MNHGHASNRFPKYKFFDNHWCKMIPVVCGGARSPWDFDHLQEFSEQIARNGLKSHLNRFLWLYITDKASKNILDIPGDQNALDKRSSSGLFRKYSFIQAMNLSTRIFFKSPITYEPSKKILVIPGEQTTLLKTSSAGFVKKYACKSAINSSTHI